MMMLMMQQTMNKDNNDANISSNSGPPINSSDMMTPGSGQNRIQPHQFYQKKASPRPAEPMPKLEIDDGLVDNKSLSPIKGDTLNAHQRNVHGS